MNLEDIAFMSFRLISRILLMNLSGNNPTRVFYKIEHEFNVGMQSYVEI